MAGQEDARLKEALMVLLGYRGNKNQMALRRSELTEVQQATAKAVASATQFQARLDGLKQSLDTTNEDLSQTQQQLTAAQQEVAALQQDVQQLVSDLNGIDLSGLAPKDSPALTGTPTAPTPAAGNDSTQVATTAFAVGLVAAEIAKLVDTAPDTLNTLNELAAALGDDPNFATTVLTALADCFTQTQMDTTAWHVPTLLNGWSTIPGGRTAYRKVLGMLFIDVCITGGTIADGTLVFQLPEGFRPTANRSYPVWGFIGGGWTPRIAVTSTGDVMVANIGANNELQGYFSISLQ